MYLSFCFTACICCFSFYFHYLFDAAKIHKLFHSGEIFSFFTSMVTRNPAPAASWAAFLQSPRLLDFSDCLLLPDNPDCPLCFSCLSCLQTPDPPPRRSPRKPRGSPPRRRHGRRAVRLTSLNTFSEVAKNNFPRW